MSFEDIYLNAESSVYGSIEPYLYPYFLGYLYRVREYKTKVNPCCGEHLF